MLVRGWGREELPGKQTSTISRALGVKLWHLREAPDPPGAPSAERERQRS